jgi:hypothetical protein
MATVQSDILKTFFAKLAKSGSIDQPTIEAVRTALTTGKKLKADDFVAILAKESGEGKP